MGSYSFTNEQLVLISKFNRFQLASWVKNLLANAGAGRGERMMAIINGLQRSLSKYSRGRSFDRVQDKMLAVLSKLEKWLRLEYVRVRTPEIITQFPNLAANPTAVKRKVHAEWEAYFKKRSY